MQAYTAAKSRLIEYQGQNSITILGRDDPGAWNLKDKVHGQLLSFGFSRMDDNALGIANYLMENIFSQSKMGEESFVRSIHCSIAWRT